jgi:hypothetical protein
MKKYTHAWLSLKAVELLRSYEGKFREERNKYLNRFLNFIGTYPTTFVRGAWFPDTIIKDNTQGGHTWKYYPDPVNGKVESRRTPSHNNCMTFVQNDLNKKLSLDAKISDLPDRCEALGQTIRDTTLITNKVKSGDVVVFNDSQIALFFLMLSHYVCDAHVPVHCDNRDFYTPSKVHPDLESFWEKEITKYYKISKKAEQFDLDEDDNLQCDISKRGYNESILFECDKIIKATKWARMREARHHWSAFLGNNNNNFWDYLLSVCVVSFHMSQLMFPPYADVNYNTIKILEVSPFREDVIKYSPFILADAVHSVALLWLSAWERWELLAKEIR